MHSTRSHLENLNYENDHRVRAARNRATERLVVEIDADPDGCGDFVEHELPTTWAVCPTCEGEGKHVNPSIDCGGLTRDDFDDDPDFAEDYMRGRYDVTCYGCQGLRVVRVVDEGKLTPELKAAWEADRKADAECRAIEAAERRMGC